MILIICSYCKVIYNIKSGGANASHGICPECFKREMEAIECHFNQKSSGKP